MEDHTCALKLPHNNKTCGGKGWRKGANGDWPFLRQVPAACYITSRTAKVSEFHRLQMQCGLDVSVGSSNKVA